MPIRNLEVLCLNFQSSQSAGQQMLCSVTEYHNSTLSSVYRGTVVDAKLKELKEETN